MQAIKFEAVRHCAERLSGMKYVVAYKLHICPRLYKIEFTCYNNFSGHRGTYLYRLDLEMETERCLLDMTIPDLYKRLSDRNVSSQRSTFVLHYKNFQDSENGIKKNLMEKTVIDDRLAASKELISGNI